MSKTLIILLVVLVLLLLGGGVWYWYTNKSTTTITQTTPTLETTKPTDAVTIQPKTIIYTETEVTEVGQGEYSSDKVKYKMTVWHLNFNSEKTNLYSHEYLGSSRSPIVYSTKNNLIYITLRDSDAGKDYIIFDANGKDVTSQYSYFRELEDYSYVDRQILPSPDGQKVAYTYGGDVAKSTEIKPEDRNKIFYKDLKTGEITTVERESFSQKGPNVLGLVGWSSEKDVLYAEMLPWEGFALTELFRVDLKNKKVTKISEAGDIASSGIWINSPSDIAVGQAAKIDKTKGMGGEEVPPVLLKLIDLKNNTSKIIVKSEDKLFQNLTLSPDSKKIYFWDSQAVKGIDVESGKEAKIVEVDTYVFRLLSSSDNKNLFYEKIVDEKPTSEGICTRCISQYLLRNLETGKEQKIVTETREQGRPDKQGDKSLEFRGLIEIK